MLVITRVFQAVITASLLMTSVLSFATTPLMDNIEYDGRRTTVWPWLSLPENSKLSELRSNERCSAIGGPRANWRIANDRLWLIGLFRCRGDIPLESVYGGTGEPIFAEWISGKINMHKGNELCIASNSDIGIFEATITLEIEKGVLAKVVEVSNANHPAVATFEDYKKMGLTESEAKKAVAASNFHCLTPSMQKQLR